MYDEVFGLWMDILTVYDLRKHLGENSLRLANIDEALVRICTSIDIEASLEDFLKDVEKCRNILKPVMECKNGTSAPVEFAIGNSHLDLEWLWTKEETRRKAARTLGNQLKLIEEYPEYKYLQSQPWLFESVKKDYPELYERVKKAVKSGNIIPEGGMWVQTDTNLPNGESLIRQFIIGKKFFKDEFGVESEILWLPDSFGLSGVLPQIMKGCGVKYLFSAKMKWQYNGGDKFPKTTFTWEGIDGSEVLAYISEEYATEATPSKIIEKWDMNCRKAEVPAVIFPYGWGDGGGGATRVHLEYLRREQDLEGMPKIKHANPVEFFRFAENECSVEDRMVGEIYYTEHRGTYTTQAKTKKLNRKSEIALRDAEFWSAVFGKDTKAETDSLWKEVAFNDFHDILPGTSISPVHDRVEKTYLEVIEKADNVAKSAISSVVSEDNGYITVFNSLSWDRQAVIEIPDGYTSVKGADAQKSGDKIVAVVSVPACGFKSFKLGREKIAEATAKDDFILENALIRAEFNEFGELISLIDKKSGFEVIEKPSNAFRMYRDMPSWWDPTDLESHYEKAEVELDRNGQVLRVNEGALFSELNIKRKINNSELTQKVILRKNSSYLEFETTVDWKEDHKVLKVEFNTNIHSDELVSEIQFGHVKRPTHRNRQFDADRFEVSQHKWSALAEAKRGFSLLNDCKYGVNAIGGKMGLTLMKSASTPTIHAEYGVHSFRYAVLPFAESFADCEVIERAYEFNMPVRYVLGKAEEQSLINVSERNIILETAKLAEDGSGDMILRLYEAKNTRTKAVLKVDFEISNVFRTNMMEEEAFSVDAENGEIHLEFRPFEVVTLRIKR